MLSTNQSVAVVPRIGTFPSPASPPTSTAAQPWTSNSVTSSNVLASAGSPGIPPSVPLMGSKSITQIEVIMRRREIPPPSWFSALSSNPQQIPVSSYLSQPKQIPQLPPFQNNGLSRSPTLGPKLTFFPTTSHQVATISSIIIRNVICSYESI